MQEKSDDNNSWIEDNALFALAFRVGSGKNGAGDILQSDISHLQLNTLLAINMHPRNARPILVEGLERGNFFDSRCPSAAWPIFKRFIEKKFRCKDHYVFFECGNSEFSGPYFQFVCVFHMRSCFRGEWIEQLHVEFSDPKSGHIREGKVFSIDYPSIASFLEAVESHSAFKEACIIEFESINVFQSIV